MPFTYTKLTPNLIVADVDRSVAFYRDVLGFTVAMQVPDASPLVFAGMQSGDVEIFLNSAEAAYAEYPAFKERPIGGTLTQFIHVTGIEQMHAELKDKVTIVMPLEKKWYGVTEFAIADPDGYIITFAEANAPA
jgi:catechol 2,3-dioxygenase-like lactoylglutathione lyase family enzyme